MSDSRTAAVVAVVDDDASVQKSLAYILESADYSVLVFGSAASFFESRSLSTIHCLVSDIDMPGIDGFHLLRAVHAIRPELPVILITGHPEMLDRLRSLDAGHHALFGKPFDGEAFLAAVSDSLENPSLPKPEA